MIYVLLLQWVRIDENNVINKRLNRLVTLINIMIVTYSLD